MPQIKEELVLIPSNQGVVTGSTQGEINLDLHGTIIDDFGLGEVTSAVNIDNNMLVSMSGLPTKIHTLQQENEDTTCVNELELKEGNTFQDIQNDTLVILKDTPLNIPTAQQVQCSLRQSFIQVNGNIT